MGVIFRESFPVVLEGVEGASGDHPRLAQASPVHLAEASGSIDELAGPAKGGADRGAESFGKADAHRVEGGGVLALGDARGHGGVPESGAIEVEAEALTFGDLGDLVDLFDRPDTAPAAVVGIFDADELCWGKMEIGGAKGGLELGGGENAPVSWEQATHQARESRRTTRFVIIDMGFIMEEDFVAGLGVDAEGELIGHRARRGEEGGFLAEEGGDPSFQLMDRGIIPEDIIADLAQALS